MNIKLRAERKGDVIVCDTVRTVQTVVGSTAVVGNYRLYSVTKTKDGSFEIPKKALAKRCEVLKKRRDALNETISIMEELLK